MRPLKLEFEGINSFSEHTVINFENLIRSGIFGIFGDTGSGKSTILDCINFALYGRVERSKEKTDIINYHCNAATVKFTFDLLNRGKRRVYNIERTIKNNKSGTHSAALYEDGVCIAQQAQDVEKKIVEIIGVKAEDFRKCIALPQGEFARFVKSAPGDRLALIERLFSLSKYGIGLRDKITEKIKDTDEEYANLAGKLSAYKDITDENVTFLEREIGQIKSEITLLSENLKTAAADYDKIKLLYAKREEAGQIKRQLAELENKRPSVEELKKEISILPLCRSALAYAQEAEQSESLCGQIKRQIEELQIKASENEVDLRTLENKLAEGDFENRIVGLTKLLARYQTCAGKPEKFAVLESQLAEKRAQYKRAEKIASETISEIGSYRKELAELEQSIEKNKSGDLEQFVNVEFKGAILRGEYVSSLEYFSELGVRLQPYADGSELYSFIKNELKSQVNLYKQRIADVKDFKLENVNIQFEALQNAIKERENDNERLRNLYQKLSQAESRSKENVNKLVGLKSEGAEIRKHADEIKAELRAVFGDDCSDYAEAERAACGELDSLKSEQKNLLNRIDKCKELRNEYNVLQGKLDESAKHAEEKRLADIKKSLEFVEKSGFKELSHCIEVAEKFAAVSDAEQEVKTFEVACATAQARYCELMATEGVEGATACALGRAEEVKKTLEEQADTLSKKLAVSEEKFKTETVKLREKNVLLKQYRKAERDRNLIYQLKDLTKGNRFLEFIADEYLNDISAMASAMLLKLTDGRYFLTYRDNNFNIGDNFNCGNLRGVNTLSGGETFLVSLSLALALSQTICSRSLKSIEFFFLDEGFGTLDSTLLDTVMNALEKLKSSSFIIGVISHVEELKHRIDNKIIVNKATESHGSTVQTSC